MTNINALGKFVAEGRSLYIDTVAVVGAGTMGADIAYNFVLAQIPVTLYDVNPDQLDKARAHIERLLALRVNRGRLDSNQAQSRLKSLQLAKDIQALSSCDLVIEAISENLALKQQILGQLDRLLPPLSILASNTSALSITQMAEATARTTRVAGFHFFYPAHTMRLVELVAGKTTSEETIETLVRVAEEIHKWPIRVRECPGFVVNRVLMRALAEVLRFQAETGHSEADIDSAVERSRIAPIGPFKLADAIGLDVVWDVSRTLEAHYGSRFALTPEIPKRVEAGQLGRKTGRGFYRYEEVSS